ncbi:hypothetical protein [Motiliproteus sp. SC1-56]|uniref:hypothetical protein n=1 Tax=Motiliproteus sp. SC1-56 TaxID=2799565 RepID=UPI001A8D6E09|nr:hypothetical protein [Motiliproteus sp. SC1-56]
MCTQEYLAKLERDFSYLCWRAEVHRFSVAEIERGVEDFRSRAYSRCSLEAGRCEHIEGFLNGRRLVIDQLRLMATNNPPSGLDRST